MHLSCLGRWSSLHGLLFAAGAAGVLSAAPRARAATIHVTTNAPEAEADGQCSLFEAVQAAESNAAVDSCEAGGGLADTIDIPAGTYQILAPARAGVGLPAVSTNIVFRGAGAESTIIRRAPNAPVFTLIEITSGLVTIQNVTLSGGKSSGGNGSTILGSGQGLTLDGVVVSGSRGAVAWWPAVGTVRNSRFEGNEGALETRFDNASPLTIEGSTFEDNVSAGPQLVLVGPITIRNSVFRGNGASGGTAGAINTYGGGTTIIESCLFEGNEARQGTGGALLASGVTLRISGSTFVGNAGGYGGAVWFDAGTIVNSTFSGNTAATRGGALEVGGSELKRLNNVTVTLNSAPQAGGIAYGGAGVFEIANSVVAANSGSDGPDCKTTSSAVITSGGHNFLGRNAGCTGYAAGTGDQVGAGSALDPLLSPLGDHGGATPTHAPFTDSPLVDRGNPASGAARACETTDQVGTTRPVGSRCDIGAYEGSIEGNGGAGGGNGTSGAGGSDTGGGTGATDGGVPGVAGSTGEGGSAGEGGGGSAGEGEGGSAGEVEGGSGNASSGARGGAAGHGGTSSAGSGRGGRGGTGMGEAGNAQAGEDGEPGESGSGGGGCGCRVAERSGSSLAALVGLLAGLGIVLRRVRRRSSE
jgi:MYXO-CTERM domain-containing protein